MGWLIGVFMAVIIFLAVVNRVFGGLRCPKRNMWFAGEETYRTKELMEDGNQTTIHFSCGYCLEEWERIIRDDHDDFDNPI
jgi:hypothetical protein